MGLKIFNFRWFYGFENLFFSIKLLIKLDWQKKQENSKQLFGDNYLTDHLVKFPTSFNFSRGSCWQTMIAILNEAYCVNFMVDIKPIYLKKRYFFQNKTNSLDKIYFCFGKIKLFKYTFKKETLTHVFLWILRNF